jgi:signal transduction histidine kinase
MVGHEFKNPMNGIINFNTLIAENAISLNNEKLQSLCSYLHISADRLLTTYDKINTYYTLQKALHLHEIPDLGEPDPHHIIDVIKSVLHKYDRVKDLDYTEPKPPLFFSKLIHTAAKELIENACKFSEKGTPIVVRIFEDATGSNISVTNTTRHTTAAALNQYRLFEQHHRDVAEQQGLGIGLAITKLIASIHKGSIAFDEVESETSVREIIALLHLPHR